jgi:cell division protein FtsW (lipid II flippase)
MKRRLGSFFLLCGLICLVIFFSSSSFDYLFFFFGGMGFISLGFLLKRSSKSRRENRFRKKKGDKHKRKMDFDDEDD